MNWFVTAALLLFLFELGIAHSLNASEVIPPVVRSSFSAVEPSGVSSSISSDASFGASIFNVPGSVQQPQNQSEQSRVPKK